MPVRVLRAPRAAASNTGGHVRGAHPAACKRKDGSIARIPVLIPVACSTVGGQAQWCRGAWFYAHWVLARFGALHAQMHFDQRVLDHLGTDRRCVHVLLLELPV
jgi:hypothetical protein